VTIRIEFTDDARKQALAAASWWRANRDEVLLFDEELTAALEMLAREPPLAQVIGEIASKPVRKVRLPRTGYALFFVIEPDLVVIHAVWHGARGSEPRLPSR
jgi:plasmid stabilization system protein ParE